jgi:phage tail-like protein
VRLRNIVAVPHAAGNRIDVRWELPPAPAFPLVRVVRREGTHPTTPNPASAAEGVVVPEIAGQNLVVDAGLQGRTVYYYGLFPYASAGAGGTIVVSDPAGQIDSFNRGAAMATSPMGNAEQMYALLPLIYHRYDTVLARTPPPAMSAEDRELGALRRFLDLPGAQLDQLRSFAAAMLDFLDLNRVDGRLLPLLAQWIGWNTDYSLEIEAQRNEIRHAPQIYRSVGLIPVVEATVKRISGQDSRTKEFVHNVATTNRPERLNLWWRRRVGTTWSPPELLSVDASFDGRPAAARDDVGRLWLFYHQAEIGGAEGGRCRVWLKSFDTATGWTASEPLSEGPLVAKDPTTALQGSRLLAFWGVYDRVTDRWRIESRTRSGGVWSVVETFLPPEGDPTVSRRKPAAVADNTGGLWLFWLERQGNRWVLKYNRHNSTTWQVNPSPTFPLDGGADPRVLDDVFALFHATDATQRLWVFWGRQDAAAVPGQTRWTVAYRVKAGLNPTVTADWSTIRTLAKAAGNDDHDRAPSGLVLANRNVELFWSSHRGGSWSVWRNVLNRATHAWGTAENLGTTPYTLTGPLATPDGADTLLIYRSSESLRYTSALYAATETVDFRYAGSTTLDTRNAGRLAQRGRFDDAQSYVYDAGRAGRRTNDDWYARDTVGVFLSAGPDDQEISRLNRVLREFMPLTDRAVFIKES